ncbi:hypothetical protein N665_0456s0002 [Sinapis alba]|nr:hypothetical protein N665_0456s0002 [Sinapis alba]
MASKTAAGKDIITLHGSAAIVSEFFYYATNSILYNRAVYPEESFVKVKKYGLPMLLTQDESVKSFLSNLTSQISGEVLERWNFCIETDSEVVEKGVSREKSGKEIMREIQAIMRQEVVVDGEKSNVEKRGQSRFGLSAIILCDQLKQGFKALNLERKAKKEVFRNLANGVLHTLTKSIVSLFMDSTIP